MRQHTNTAEMPSRRLLKQYDNTATRVTSGGTNALGNTNPNTLHSNFPSRSDATGVAGKNGVVSFMHNGAAQVISLFFWCERLNRITSAQGWIEGAESAAGYQKTVNQYSLCTFTAPEGVPYFLMATGTDITECLVSSDSDGNNPNQDQAKTGGGT